MKSLAARIKEIALNYLIRLKKWIEMRIQWKRVTWIATNFQVELFAHSKITAAQKEYNSTVNIPFNTFANCEWDWCESLTYHTQCAPCDETTPETEKTTKRIDYFCVQFALIGSMNCIRMKRRRGCCLMQGQKKKEHTRHWKILLYVIRNLNLHYKVGEQVPSIAW